MEDIIKKHRNGEELTPEEENKVMQRILLVHRKQQLLKQLKTKKEEKNNPFGFIAIVWQRREHLAPAAAILLLVALGWWVWPKTPQYKQLTDTYLAEMPNYPSAKMGETDVVQENETGAKSAYTEKKFNEAATLFANIVATNHAQPIHRFYLAMSYMQQQNKPDYAAAIPQLITVQNTWADKALEANWYLGLAYIKTGQFDLARTELLKNMGKYKTTEIQALLAALPKN
jgi:tetratricopeptide (TPR) repeat protein